MNKFHFLSLFCLIVGILFFYMGFLSGDVKTGVFVIFPFLSGSGVYAFFGFIFIIFTIFLFIFGFSTYSETDEYKTGEYGKKSPKKTSIKGGGVVLIGPIPIVFATNWKIAIALMIIAVIVILVAYFSFSYL